MLGVAMLLSIIYIVWQWNRTKTLTRFARETESMRGYLEEMPDVSIVVDAMNETDQLNRFLPLVLHQDYPGRVEVIVVVDSNAEATSDMLSDMKAHFPNLHTTFVPYGSRSLSRKKLALMIGIKAAQYDIILTTTAACRPTNDQWLKLMMRNFVPGVDVVLGYSHYRYHRDKRMGRRMRIFDTVTTGVQWLTCAIAGKPHRGTSDNMAYRKQLFYNVRGFANSMDMKWGEDDVFLKEICNRTNTRVEIAPEAQLNVYYESLRRAHSLLKMRRDFTSRKVRRLPFILQGFMSSIYWLRFACLAAAVALTAAFNLNSIGIVGIAVFLVLLLTWIPSASLFATNCKILQAPPLRATVPFFIMWRPLVNICYAIRESFSKKSNLTSFYD